MHISPEEFLQHYGVKGMKWGVRRYQNKDGSLNSAGKKRYKAKDSDSKVTKRVKKDLAGMSAEEFRQKYQVSNRRYMKRVDRYGDPYMNSPLAKIGKKMERQATINKQKAAARSLRASEKKREKIQKDIDNLKSNKKKMLALKSKNGKPLFVEKDIDEMIAALELEKSEIK